MLVAEGYFRYGGFPPFIFMIRFQNSDKSTSPVYFLEKNKYSNLAVVLVWMRKTSLNNLEIRFGQYDRFRPLQNHPSLPSVFVSYYCIYRLKSCWISPRNLANVINFTVYTVTVTYFVLLYILRLYNLCPLSHYPISFHGK